MSEISGHFIGNFVPDNSEGGGCLTTFVVIALIIGAIIWLFDSDRDVEKKQSSDRVTEESYYSNKTKSENPNYKKAVNKSSAIIDYDTFISSSVINDMNSVDVSVLIVDEKGEISSISHDIANLYNRDGTIGNTGLIKSGFFQYDEFEDLYNGDSSMIKKLKLKKHTDYLIIGRMNISYKKSELVENTLVCKMLLSTNIISTIEARVIKSFTISAVGNGASESQSERKAMHKLLQVYSKSYSSL
mgnify:FL=1